MLPALSMCHKHGWMQCIASSFGGAICRIGAAGRQGQLVSGAADSSASKRLSLAAVNFSRMAEDAGFEPARALTQPAFQASAIGH